MPGTSRRVNADGCFYYRTPSGLDYVEIDVINKSLVDFYHKNGTKVLFGVGQIDGYSDFTSFPFGRDSYGDAATY
jgi:hypothetical protein